MKFLYNVGISLAEKILPASRLLSDKMKLFVDGRKEVFSTLEKKTKPNDKFLWFHAASLGEYEQSVPVIEALKQDFSDYKILVTFFSPSGYENKKNSKLADVITYLPLDTKANAEKFVEIVNPKMVFFIKYEVWPNYLAALENKKIPTVLFSANFRKDQVYFKNYGGLMRKSLQKFDHIFVQEKSSADLLQNIGIKNVSVSGDTRFDRVNAQLEANNKIDFISEFKNGQLCIVVGSSWPEDEDLLVDYINDTSEAIKWIIAPHIFKNVKNLANRINKKTLLFSEMKNQDLKSANVFIVDTIGYLTRIYSYADIAYVGGAAGKTGLHNILEPAAFGIPIVIGENHQKFPEAEKLKNHGGLFVVSNGKELKDLLDKLISDTDFRNETGEKSAEFVQQNMGATKMIRDYAKLRLKSSIPFKLK
ncbi:MAG TPA: glycosyltransferase N-terminal domain-containing protein [Salinimicrobium sp.]|nr:glycosyltransferase N-terminal domain-containing protein [Salinimicrobium sp.]